MYGRVAKCVRHNFHPHVEIHRYSNACPAALSLGRHRDGWKSRRPYVTAQFSAGKHCRKTALLAATPTSGKRRGRGSVRNATGLKKVKLILDCSEPLNLIQVVDLHQDDRA
jgi:hypothetical protein